MQLDDHIRLYEPSDLHVTIATLCRCTNEDLDSTRSAMKHVADAWRSAISGLGATQISLQRKAAMFEDGVGVLFWAEMGMNNVEEWRSVLRKVKPTVERDVNLKHMQKSEGKISIDLSRFFTPDIIHSTVLRWKKTPPSHITLVQARREFEQGVMDTWSEQEKRQDGQTDVGQTDVVVPVTQLRIMEETAPCLSATEIHHLIELKNEVN